MENQQPQNQQTQTVQPTSFWDFRHKKMYADRKEIIIDFLVGFMGLQFLPAFFIFLNI